MTKRQQLAYEVEQRRKDDILKDEKEEAQDKI